MSEFTQEISELGAGIWNYLFGRETSHLADTRASNQIVTVGSRAYSSLQPVSDALAAAHSEIKQLKFLLASAPMINAPHPLNARPVLANSRSPFAYIHPKTMASLLVDTRSARQTRGFMVFPGSPTKWVLLSLMPEGRVIYSPLPVPGIEQILAQ